MNIVIVCGGTGGHLFPGMAVGEELLQRGHQVLLLISEKDVDQMAVKNAGGFLLETLPSVGWKGFRPDRLIHFNLMMLKAMRKTRGLFKNFEPNAVLGMGGFSSVAPLLEARRRGIPSCVHESNVIPGRANRLAARFCKRVAVGLEAAQKAFSCQTIHTGTPIRVSVRRQKVDAAKIREAWGLKPSGKVVVVMGGSQGARGLNQVVVDAARSLNAMDIQWIHLAGMGDEKRIQEEYQKGNVPAKVLGFCHQMEQLYAIADLVIARSGAASLSEISEWRLPSILIPFPFATDHHQSANAGVYAQGGAAILLEENQCGKGRLRDEIQSLLKDEPRLGSMAEAMGRMAISDAHLRMADLMEDLMGEKKGRAK